MMQTVLVTSAAKRRAVSCCVISETVGAKEPLQPGLLVAEPFSWKSLLTGDALLRIRTTGTRSTVLCLPEGFVQHR